MILISMRGNISGVEERTQNKPYQVNEVLKTGMHCWVDVWWKDDIFYLGTDEPTYPVKQSFISMYSVWANAMDFVTLLKLTECKSPHNFFYRGEPILSNTGHIITECIIDGYESSTILISDDSIYSTVGLYGIVSNNILEFANG